MKPEKPKNPPFPYDLDIKSQMTPFLVKDFSTDGVVYSHLDDQMHIFEASLRGNKNVYFPESENFKEIPVKKGGYLVLPHCFFTVHSLNGERITYTPGTLDKQ